MKLDNVERRQVLLLGATTLGGIAYSRTGDGDEDEDEDDSNAAAVPWATGGTAAMTDQASYPDPFTELPCKCVATCAMTAGPCYSAQSAELRDISYGYRGLPMRLSLQVLDDACRPVSDASVDVWHCGPGGVYSGNDGENENVDLCTGNDKDFASHLYFRGRQTTDEAGIVSFDSCFPGWYRGRTIHVHLTISFGNDAYVTTQIGFSDVLDDSIVASEPLYKDRGARDTTNVTDTVLPIDDSTDYVFETQQMPDGALLAWKTVVLRSSLSNPLCAPAL